MTTHYYIFLENVRFYSYYGVVPQETAIGNKFIISLRLKIDFGGTTETDEVGDTVSYIGIHVVLEERVGIPSKLLERAYRQTAKRLLRGFPKISEIEVRLSKRNLPMGTDIDSTGIEMHCTED